MPASCSHVLSPTTHPESPPILLLDEDGFRKRRLPTTDPHSGCARLGKVDHRTQVGLGVLILLAGRILLSANNLRVIGRSRVGWAFLGRLTKRKTQLRVADLAGWPAPPPLSSLVLVSPPPLLGDN